MLSQSRFVAHTRLKKHRGITRWKFHPILDSLSWDESKVLTHCDAKNAPHDRFGIMTATPGFLQHMFSFFAAVLIAEHNNQEGTKLQVKKYTHVSVRTPTIVGEFAQCMGAALTPVAELASANKQQGRSVYRYGFDILYAEGDPRTWMHGMIKFTSLYYAAGMHLRIGYST